MRLLIINPNTSEGVTARIRAAAEAAAQPTDRFITCSAAFGPELIVTRADAEQAARGVVETVRAHEGPLDGVILGSFGDTGAAEVRAMRPRLPVIGIAGAAFAVVRALEAPFGIVTFGAELVPGLRAKVHETGVEPQLLDIAHASSQPIGDPGTVQTRFFDDILALCADMETRGAGAIVLGGGPLAGMAQTLAPHCALPLIDGTSAAITLMRTLTTARDRPRTYARADIAP